MRAIAPTLICGAVTSAVVPAQAQSLVQNGREEITIEASTDSIYRGRNFQRAYSVMRPQVLSASRPVSYADLTLSNPMDAAEFERRIEETAKDLCRELGWRVAHGHFDIGYSDIGIRRDCVKMTLEKARMTASLITPRNSHG
jgi:UrcA family protein